MNYFEGEEEAVSAEEIAKEETAEETESFGRDDEVGLTEEETPVEPAV